MGIGKTIFQVMNTGHARWYQATGGRFAGKHLLLLTTTGRKTGRARTVPLRAVEDGDNLLVAGSVGGAPNHPGWYYNLVADPAVSVQVGKKVEGRTARVTEGEERDRLWQMFVDADKRFASYESKTDRVIPVVVLEP
ncbi:MAG: nitroreductase family deazaflavin-dependent oxidoreductase [Acidimicrobiia bacterium]